MESRRGMSRRMGAEGREDGKIRRDEGEEMGE